MRERLIEILKGFRTPICEGLNFKLPDVEAIADHLLSEGVIVPPIEIGQKVWYIKGGYYNSVNARPREIEITEINKKWHGKILEWGFIANSTRYRFSSIGKTVFLTKEEAEKALAEEVCKK